MKAVAALPEYAQEETHVLIIVQLIVTKIITVAQFHLQIHVRHQVLKECGQE